MAIGYLQVQARAAREAVPAEGARVWILDEEGNAVYQLTTDESGDTQTAALETVDRMFSQNPEYLGIPYRAYQVIVEAEGYETAAVTEIPVFEGETAVLPVSLIPREGRKIRQPGGSLVVGGPAVAHPEGRGQEGENGEKGPGEGRLLRHVAIPDPITVHLGAPGAQAANVRVPFLDYVKNVASSEIYPTWPEAALKANIYAIMTFALNRVYTEWYRSRGYDFDITGSTAYDQYYVPGRPIYDSISRAVDEVYGEYVRRGGQEAPYFTSFCNGSTVTCGGMSQWGTVTLADRGYTPLQILRYYYPDDVEIARTDIVTGELSSYPGAALRKGSGGQAVEAVQEYLGRIRQNYPAIPAITDPAGTFGESTREAVVTFQSAFDLVPDGIVGLATWSKLSSVYTAVTRLAELDSEGTRLGIGTVPPASVLRRGSRGQDVVTLQYLLNVASRYMPSVPAPAQDGIFGSGTQSAVLAFQRASGLAADGVAGPRTWRALYDLYLGMEGERPSGGAGETGYITYTVRAGDTLWQLARRYGVAVEAIKKASGITSDMLRIGQELRIPVSR